MYDHQPKQETNQILKDMREESEAQERNLEQKIKNGTEKLKNKLKMMKSDVEKISKNPSLIDAEKPPTEKNTATKNKANDNLNIGSSNNYLIVNHNYKKNLKSSQNFIRSPSNNLRNEGNDSKLSSFHNHNFHKNAYKNDKNKENIEKIDTGSSGEILLNTASKDNFFKTENNLKANNKLNNVERQIFSEINNSVTQSIDSHTNKTDIFKFSGPNFNSKDSLSLSDTKKDIEYENDEYSNNYIYQKNLNERNSLNSLNNKNENLDYHEYSKREIDSPSNTIKIIKEKNNYSFNTNKNNFESDNNFHNKSNSGNTYLENQNIFNNFGTINSKRNIKEYLNELENKNLVKIKVEGKNKWVLDFGDEMENHEINQSNKNNKYYNIKVDSNTNKCNSINFKNCLNSKVDRKKYIESKNHLDILKKEKNSLEKIIKQSKNILFPQKYSNYNYTRGKDNNNGKLNIKNNTKKNTQSFTYNKDFKKYDDLIEYEIEVFKKIENETLFSQFDKNNEKEDALGVFIDRVIDGSLYLYKNRNCHNCSKLLSNGKSTSKCPKNHHKNK